MIFVIGLSIMLRVVMVVFNFIYHVECCVI